MSSRDHGGIVLVGRDSVEPKKESDAALFQAMARQSFGPATFMMARELSTRTYPQIGINEGHHPVSHHQNVPEQIDKHARINTYHISLFAEFLEKLRKTPDGDGNMLDHSMILYGSALSDPDRHNHENLPIVLAGRGSGTIKTGRHIKYDNAFYTKKEVPLSNLLLSLLDRMGIPAAGFGDSNGRAAHLDS